MPTTTTPLLNFDSTRPAGPEEPTTPGPPKRGPYQSTLLRSIRKRERDTLAGYYDAQGDLLIEANRPTLSQIAQLKLAGLHDGNSLRAAGREMAKEVNQALDRLAAGISFERATIRGKPVEPKFHYGYVPKKSRKNNAPYVLYTIEKTPLASETEAAWWSNGTIAIPGPVPQRYATPEIDTLPLESLRRLIRNHRMPPAPGTTHITPIAYTEQGPFRSAKQRVWLSDGTSIDGSHFAAITHEHGGIGRLVLTASTIDNGLPRSYCAWTQAEDGHWRPLAIFAGDDKGKTRDARNTAGRIDNWLERLLASHAATETPPPKSPQAQTRPATASG